jgi:glutamyl-tRNA synthetase
MSETLSTGATPSTGANDTRVRVRFCPSPTGNPHVGLVRTALFNYAFARHHGGDFVFRIEDTDAARDSEESYDALLETLRWLGLDWDEGPEVGGPHAPYRQSQRTDVYADVARRLLDAGLAYESFSTPEEVEERRRAAGQDPKLGYDNADRHTSDEEKAAFRAAGREPVLRIAMPAHDLVVDDLVRGEITFAAGSVPDFVIVRANGQPLYTLVNPVDDALMGITHVLRGEDLLSSTPRQLALYGALAKIGVGSGATPRFGHLPYVMGQGNKKLSKRDPESAIGFYRDAGFVPEGLLNYLALLGWAIADDNDVFTLEEMIAAFDISRVNASPARFDLKKAEAINATHLRLLAPEDFAARVTHVLSLDGLVSTPPTAEQSALVAASAPLIQERMTLLGEVTGMVGFLFVPDESFAIEDAARTKVLKAEAAPVLAAASAALEDAPEWTTEAIEAALRAALIEGLGLKPKLAFGPVRVAITGRQVSPPLFESMELLGRERSLARLRAAGAAVAD